MNAVSGRQILPTRRTWLACAAAAVSTLVSGATVRAEVTDTVLQAEADRVAVVAKVEPSVVAIFGPGGRGGGSGVLISPDGYALSNYHVTRGAGIAMKCGLADGRLYDAVLVGVDMTGDVALIKMLGRDDFPCAELGNSDQVRVGDWTFAMGNPFLLATDFKPTVTYGIVSGIQRYQYPAGTLLEYADCIQVDASINPGNSGGPLFNATGQLVGINGRGSFEKRGRVNVGVGYAISINQIKNFLGCLKSGRYVDHATLGARLISNDDGRVVVGDVIESSDAFRRGLRYQTELLNFGGRPIRTVNAFKNALGVYPRDWRVPVVFRHEGERYSKLVRLQGAHRAGELEKLDADGEEGKPKIKPEKGKPEKNGEIEIVQINKLPDVVKAVYEARPGYVNYYFNRLNQERVWNAAKTRLDATTLDKPWTIRGTTTDPAKHAIRAVIKDDAVFLQWGKQEFSAELREDWSKSVDPPGSGGLLTAMAAWRRFLRLGPTKYGDVSYLGTAPLEGQTELVDVLVATHGEVRAWFYVEPGTGRLLSVELFTDPDSDPCEILFTGDLDLDGRKWPLKWEIRSNDAVFGSFEVQSYENAEGGA